MFLYMDNILLKYCYILVEILLEAINFIFVVKTQLRNLTCINQGLPKWAITDTQGSTNNKRAMRSKGATEGP